jgi:hypothetical protein
MAPAKLALDDISTALERIADSHRVVPSTPVVLRAFVLRRVIAALATPILRRTTLLLLLLLPFHNPFQKFAILNQIFIGFLALGFRALVLVSGLVGKTEECEEREREREM